MFIVNFRLPNFDFVIVDVGKNGYEFSAAMKCIFFFNVGCKLSRITIFAALLSFDQDGILARIIFIDESNIEFVMFWTLAAQLFLRE